MKQALGIFNDFFAGQDPFADFSNTPKGSQGWDVKITTVKRADGSTYTERSDRFGTSTTRSAAPSSAGSVAGDRFEHDYRGDSFRTNPKDSFRADPFETFGSPFGGNFGGNFGGSQPALPAYETAPDRRSRPNPKDSFRTNPKDSFNATQIARG